MYFVLVERFAAICAFEHCFAIVDVPPATYRRETCHTYTHSYAAVHCITKLRIFERHRRHASTLRGVPRSRRSLPRELFIIATYSATCKRPNVSVVCINCTLYYNNIIFHARGVSQRRRVESIGSCGRAASRLGLHVRVVVPGISENASCEIRVG